MNKVWLRGIMLGASLALLLAGGVAVAQTLTVEADQDCVECWPGPYDHSMPPDEYLVDITVDGWDPAEMLCVNLYLNGESVFEDGQPTCGHPPRTQPATMSATFPCDVDGTTTELSGLGVRLSLDEIEDISEFYGEWKLRAWQPGTDNADSVTWTVAAVCGVMEEEFVPEPGTIALLGSGLSCLAGYASLRWRSRQ